MIDFPRFNNDTVILFKAPIDSITPPKTIAVITNQIVFIIPNIPPLENKSFNSLFPDSILVSIVIEFTMALYAPSNVNVEEPDN